MKKLSLSDYAHVAEILACGMVIVSLIYGISEYNRVRLIETSEIDDILYQSSEATNLAIVSNDELAYLVYKAEVTSENLTALEKNRYARLRFIFFNDWEKAFALLPKIKKRLVSLASKSNRSMPSPSASALRSQGRRGLWWRQHRRFSRLWERR